MHHPPGQRNGDEQGEEHEVREVAGKQDDEALRAGAEDFADADLFSPLQYVVGGEAEETETGDQDGDGREEAEDLAEAGVGLVLLVERFVEEEIVERVVWKMAFPAAFYRGNGSVKIGAVEFDGIIAADIGYIQEEHRVDGFLQSLVVIICGDADDMQGVAAAYQLFTKGIGGFGIAHHTGGGLVDQCAFVVRGKLG